MPFHDRAAWKPSAPCFEETKESMGGQVPPRAAKLLRDYQIEAVADYIVVAIQGRAEPNKAECIAFWGENARECGRFK